MAPVSTPNLIDLTTSHLQSLLDAGTVKIEDGHKAAFITHLGYNKGATATAAFAINVGNGWQVNQIIDWSHDEGVTAGVNVVWSK